MKPGVHLGLVALVACSSAEKATTSAPSPCPAAVATRALVSLGNVGGLGMYVHVPAAVRSGAPLVVALHGCGQTAADYENAGWNELADRDGFVVVYAEQSVTNDLQRCFRWWLPAQATREQGEAKAIRSMIDRARSDYGATGKTFVTGLSAGGAMTAALLAAYPDVFEAGAIMAGVPAGCATTQFEAGPCLFGVEKTSAAWAAVVPSTSTPPRVSIWQGSTDLVVRPPNATALVRQWTAVNGVSDVPASTETIGAATHAVYPGGRVESWIVDGMSHGVAVSPSDGCGKAAAYVLDVHLCSTARAAAFFGLGGGGPAATPSAPPDAPVATAPASPPAPCR